MAELGDTRGIATALTELGRIAWRLGDAERATALVEECLTLVRGVGSLTARSQPLTPYVESPISLLAAMAAARGDTERATALFGEDVAMCRARDDPHGVANALRGLARLLAVNGDAERATSLLQESLRLLWELEDRGCIPINLEQLACIASEYGDAERAVLLFAAASTLREASGVTTYPNDAADNDRAMPVARASIGEQIYQATWAEGRAMTLEHVVAYALRNGRRSDRWVCHWAGPQVSDGPPTPRQAGGAETARRVGALTHRRSGQSAGGLRRSADLPRPLILRPGESVGLVFYSGFREDMDQVMTIIQAEQQTGRAGAIRIEYRDVFGDIHTSAAPLKFDTGAQDLDDLAVAVGQIAFSRAD